MSARKFVFRFLSSGSILMTVFDGTHEYEMGDYILIFKIIFRCL